MSANLLNALAQVLIPVDFVIFSTVFHSPTRWKPSECHRLCVTESYIVESTKFNIRVVRSRLSLLRQWLLLKSKRTIKGNIWYVNEVELMHSLRSQCFLVHQSLKEPLFECGACQKKFDLLECDIDCRSVVQCKTCKGQVVEWEPSDDFVSAFRVLIDALFAAHGPFYSYTFERPLIECDQTYRRGSIVNTADSLPERHQEPAVTQTIDIADQNQLNRMTCEQVDTYVTRLMGAS